MSSKSNLFVSAALVASLAACQSASPKMAPAQAERVATASPAASAVTSSPTPAMPAAPAADAPIPPRAAQQYAQALQIMKSGRTTDAELEFKQLAAAYPQFAGPELNLGVLYLKESRLPEAEAAFKSALQIAPSNPVAGNELGIAERRLGKFADAESAYQKAIAAEPNYAVAHLNLGVLYDLYLSEPQKALEQFERYVEIAGENKQVSGWLVELRKRVGAAAPPAKKEPA